MGFRNIPGFVLHGRWRQLSSRKAFSLPSQGDGTITFLRTCCAERHRVAGKNTQSFDKGDPARGSPWDALCTEAPEGLRKRMGHGWGTQRAAARSRERPPHPRLMSPATHVLCVPPGQRDFDLADALDDPGE